MPGFDLKFNIYDSMLIIGAVLYGAGMILSVGILYYRKHPRIHRLSPKLLCASYFLGFLWWMTSVLNSQLQDLWKAASLTCWMWGMSLRLILLTAFVGMLLSRQVVLYTRWHALEKYRRTIGTVHLVIWTGCISIIGIFSIVKHPAGKTDCDIPDTFSYPLIGYQAALVVTFCTMSAALGYTVYRDTEADYAHLHPKAYNAVVDFTIGVLYILSYPLLFHTGISDECLRENLYALIGGVLLPALLLWLEVIPAALGCSQQIPDMMFFPNQVFDHRTGTFSSNVNQLPKLRRVIADDKRPPVKQNDYMASHITIPAHDTEKLFTLIIQGETDECRGFILDKGVELLSCPGPKGETALHVAVMCPQLSYENRIGMIDLLVDMKASLGAQDHEGRTPLHHAAYMEDARMVCLMVQSAMKSAKLGDTKKMQISNLINIVANDGATPLHIATKLDDLGTITTLLGLGADPSKTSPKSKIPKDEIRVEDWEAHFEKSIGEITVGKSAFILAVELNALHIVQQMMLTCPKHCSIDQVSPLGMTSLMTATYFGHTKLALYLLDQGATVWHTMVSGRASRKLTVLHCCAIGGDPCALHTVVKVLISGKQVPIGGTTDTDTYDRCSYSVSESEVSNYQVAGDTVTMPLPQQKQSKDGSGSPDNSYTAQLLSTAMTLSDRFNLEPPIDKYPVTHELDVGIEEELLAALTVLNSRGELQPMPAEHRILSCLDEGWPDCDETGDEQQSNEKVSLISSLLSNEHLSPEMLSVLTQGQYQWKPESCTFGSHMTKAKAKQLAQEIRRSVVNPKITLANISHHERRLNEQVLMSNVTDDDRATLLRAIQVVCDVDKLQQREEKQPTLLTNQNLSPLSDTSPRRGSIISNYSIASGGNGSTLGTNLDLTDMCTIPINVHRYLNRPDCWGRTPLHYAVVMRNVGVVYLLVSLGSSSHLKDRKSRRRKDILGLTPLGYAENFKQIGSMGVTIAINEAETAKGRNKQQLLDARVPTTLR